MDLPIIFSSGLPRSGSTLLQNLLAQHPLNHVTPTNDLLNMIMVTRDSWMASSGFMAQGLKVIEPRICSMMLGMVQGFYREEFAAGKAVFDKSRGHLSWVTLWEQILGRRINVVVCVRDIRDVLASFEKIFRKSAITDHAAKEAAVFKRLTIQGRAELLCAIEGTVGYVINTLRDAVACGYGDRLIIVPYRELTNYPVRTIKKIQKECGLPDFDCFPSHVEQVTKEDDTIYGMALHEIRPVVVPDFENRWQGIIPQNLADFLNDEYSDIQHLARGPVGRINPMNINRASEYAPPERIVFAFGEKDVKKQMAGVN